MFPKQLFRGVLIPSYVAAGVAQTKKNEPEQKSKEECDDSKKLIRARELPLYVDPPRPVTCTNIREEEEGLLLTTIRCARQEIQAIVGQARAIRNEVSHLVDEVTKETEGAVEYLRQEENLLPRLGAIGLGGFAGYLLAVRRGFFRKILYSSVGAGVVASVAYPNEARDYAEEVVAEAKKYSVIAYHFLNGEQTSEMNGGSSSRGGAKSGNHR